MIIDHFSILMNNKEKGDDKIRNLLMKNYKEFVQKEMKREEIVIYGRGISDDIECFDFTYKSSGVSGLFRANAVMDQQGFIVIDVIIFET